VLKLTSTAAITCLLLSLLVVHPAAAATDPAAGKPDCKVLNAKSGTCIIEVTVPGARPVTNTDGPPRTGGGPRVCSTVDGRGVPCSDPVYGSWSSVMQCYIARVEPQPPASDPSWQGRYPEGAIYACAGESANDASTRLMWLPQSPDAAQISPAQAAQIVVQRMDVRAADIGIVPEDEPGRIGAVGAPVWMWTTPGPTTFGPQTLTGSAGGVTITATAKVDRIVWSMGDGTSVTCRTPGTVYEDRYGFNMSPDCGHRYQRTSAGKPANAYPITATSFWLVNWTGPGGSSGQIPLTLSSRTAIVVGELQALVTR